jgi:hypothetical protein
MTLVSRRRFLGVFSTWLALAIAGCSDEEPEFLVTNTQLIHRQGDNRFDYPEDVLVRVAVENGKANRQDGTLRITLTHDPGTGEEDVEEWTQEDEISLGQATSKQLHYRFRDVFDPGDGIANYAVDAKVEE